MPGSLGCLGCQCGTLVAPSVPGTGFSLFGPIAFFLLCCKYAHKKRITRRGTQLKILVGPRHLRGVRFARAPRTGSAPLRSSDLWCAQPRIIAALALRRGYKRGGAGDGFITITFPFSLLLLRIVLLFDCPEAARRKNNMESSHSFSLFSPDSDPVCALL